MQEALDVFDTYLTETQPSKFDTKFCGMLITIRQNADFDANMQKLEEEVPEIKSITAEQVDAKKTVRVVIKLLMREVVSSVKGKGGIVDSIDEITESDNRYQELKECLDSYSEVMFGVRSAQIGIADNSSS